MRLVVELKVEVGYTSSGCPSERRLDLRPLIANPESAPKVSLRRNAVRYLRRVVGKLKSGPLPSQHLKPPVFDWHCDPHSWRFKKISELDAASDLPLDATSDLAQLGSTSSLPLSSCPRQSGNEVAFIAATGINPYGRHHEASVADTDLNFVFGPGAGDCIVELPATEFIPVAAYTSFPPQTQIQATEHHQTAKDTTKEKTRSASDIASNDVAPIPITLWPSDFVGSSSQTHFGDPPRATACNVSNGNTTIRTGLTPRSGFGNFHTHQQIRRGPRDSTNTSHQTSHSQTMLATTLRSLPHHASAITESEYLHSNMTSVGLKGETAHKSDHRPGLSNTEQGASSGPLTPKPRVSRTLRTYGHLSHVQEHRELTSSEGLPKPLDYGGHCNDFEQPCSPCSTNAIALDKSCTSGHIASENIGYEEVIDKPSCSISPFDPTNLYIPGWRGSVEATLDAALARLDSHSIDFHGIERPIRSSSVATKPMKKSTKLVLTPQRSASTPTEISSADEGGYRQALLSSPITTRHRTTSTPRNENDCQAFCNEQDLMLSDHTTRSPGGQSPSGSSSLQRTLSSEAIRALLGDIPFMDLLTTGSLGNKAFYHSAQDYCRTREELNFVSQPRHRFTDGKMNVSAQSSLMRRAYPELQCDCCSQIFSGPDRRRDLARHRRETCNPMKPPIHTIPSCQTSLVESLIPSILQASTSIAGYEAHRLEYLPLPTVEPRIMHPSIPCELCDKTFTGKYARGNMRRHTAQTHRSTYKCRACDKVYLQDDARRKHERQVHRQK